MNSNTSASSTIKLNEASLFRLPGNVCVPKYERHQIKNGIVHIGVGGFHRSHQAIYLDDYFHQNPGSDWGICGVGLLDNDYDRRMRDALLSQDCLYTLVERSPSRDRARIIGSITQYLFAPDNRQAVIEVLADPKCRLITLTITENGYYYIEGSGEFDVNHPTIQYDLQHPDQPIGTYGFLTAALEKRRKQGLAPFTVLSCDNIQGNGDMVGKMLTTFAQMRDPALGRWIFVLGSLRDQLQLGGAIDCLSLTVAAWCRYLVSHDDQGQPITIDDPLVDMLTQRASLGELDPRPLLSISEIFGDLVQSPRFVEAVTNQLRSLHEFGVKGTLVRLSQPL